MNIDQALDILRKCCENMDIDDNGHEVPCGKCEVCQAVAVLEDASDELDFWSRRGDYQRICTCPKGEPFMPTDANCPRHGLRR